MPERTVHVGDTSPPTLDGPGPLHGVSLPPAIRFESNLDDLVDANLRFMASTRWGARQRRRSMAGAVLAFIVSMFIVVAVMSGVRTSEGLLMLAALATVFGLAFGLIYRSGYDALVRSRVRRVLHEQLGDRSPWRCEIALRGEGAWSRDHGVELLFPWGDSTAVEDGAVGVELKFRTGFILARARAFATPDERRRFVEAARTLAESHRPSPARG